MHDDEDDYDPLESGGRGNEDFLVQNYAEILQNNGLSTCAYNITACRLSAIACQSIDQKIGNSVMFRIMYSEVLDGPALFVGIDAEDGGFSPMLMVMTSEYIGRLRLFCGGPDCNHDVCEALPDGLRQQIEDQRSMKPEVDTSGFTHIVDSVADELPTYEDLAKFYELGNEDD